jgi:hypothetical protein
MAKGGLRDSEDLASFGFKQELNRTLGSFSSFAAGFSYLSILTGLFQMFHLGALLYTAGLLLIGGLYYSLVQRHKTGVLKEHRA